MSQSTLNLKCNETGNDPIVDFPGQQRILARKINKRIIAHPLL